MARGYRTELPADTQVEGFDRVAAKFRTKGRLLVNATPRYGDILEPLPEKFHSQYSVVHLRCSCLP